MVRELLNNGANVNTADKEVVTPLYIASQKRHFELVRQLLKNGTNMNTADKERVTALYIIVGEGLF